jgi:hypothetical protein
LTIFALFRPIPKPTTMKPIASLISVTSYKRLRVAR